MSKRSSRGWVRSGTTSGEGHTKLLNIAGTAADDRGVTSVSWSSNRTGGGAATGLASWQANGIQLLRGINVLTISARDAAGNRGTATLQVNYTPPDTVAPVVVFDIGDGSESAMASVTLHGTAADNVGVTSVAWSNDRGGSGTASGTANWTASSIPLQIGPNIIPVTGSDAAGNSSTAAITVTYIPPDTTPPKVAINFPPLNESFWTEEATINVSGTASDGGTLAQVEWSSDRGGRRIASGSTV